MQNLTEIFKALSDLNRLRVVNALLNNHELCACQLTELIQVTGATASRHMSVLIASGLVTSRKQGRWVHYKLQRKNPDFKILIDWLEKKLKTDPVFKLDIKKLKKITSCDPEDLCRKQRGDKCCPK